MIAGLEENGWDKIEVRLPETDLHCLRAAHFVPGQAGVRCLLEDVGVATAARAIQSQLNEAGLLPASAVAIQAIAFDKPPAANWKVTWHQDVMFPLARPAKCSGYLLPTQKDGINYARLPREVLEQMLAVRLHLDDCDERNGPLRVAPGSHRLGILPSTEIAEALKIGGEVACTAAEGEAILMRPLLLRASSSAAQPRHRRVLHFVFHAGTPVAEDWYRRV